MNGQMNGQKPGAEKPSWNQCMDVLYFWSRTAATMVTPIIRGNFGKEGLGWYGVAAMVVLFLAAGSNRDIWLWWYFGLWLFALVYQRVASIRSVVPVHSFYGGFPELASKLFRQPKENNARNLEAAMVMFVAICLCEVAPMLSAVLLVSMAGLIIVRGMEYSVNVMRHRRMHDAQMEYQVMQEYWRGGRNDW